MVGGTKTAHGVPAQPHHGKWKVKQNTNTCNISTRKHDLKCEKMGTRRSFTRRRVGIQIGQPAQGVPSGMEGSGAARSQEAWLPSTCCSTGHTKAQDGCTKAESCALKDMQCVSHQTDTMSKEMGNIFALQQTMR